MLVNARRAIVAAAKAPPMRLAKKVASDRTFLWSFVRHGPSGPSWIRMRRGHLRLLRTCQGQFQLRRRIISFSFLLVGGLLLREDPALRGALRDGRVSCVLRICGRRQHWAVRIGDVGQGNRLDRNRFFARNSTRNRCRGREIQGFGRPIPSSGKR